MSKNKTDISKNYNYGQNHSHTPSPYSLPYGIDNVVLYLYEKRQNLKHFCSCSIRFDNDDIQFILH